MGARKKRGLQGIQQPPPVSGDSWWQLEKTTSSYDGKQVICMVKSLLVNRYKCMYLCLN